jgi:peptide/nickel transport system substrate-binding protein
MVITKKPLAAVAAAAALAVGLAGCGGGSTKGNSSDNNSSSAAGSKGGTLNYLTFRPAEHLDPQRTYIGRDLANLSRLAYRSLVTYPITTDVKKGTTPVPDLATDTGTTTSTSTRTRSARSCRSPCSRA